MNTSYLSDLVGVALPVGLATISLYYPIQVVLNPPARRLALEIINVGQSLLVASFLIWLTYRQWQRPEKRRKAGLYFGGWCLAGWFILALVTQILVLREVASAVPAIEADLFISDVALTGATLGAVVGTYDSQRRDQQRELEELTEFQEFLLQTLRHDIRNDANVISGYIDLIRETIAENRDAADHLDTIERKTAHIVDLTHTSRNLTKLEEPVGVEALSTVSIDASLHRAIEYGRRTFPEAEIQAEDSIPEFTVSADGLLDSLFENVIRNAIQHNDQDTPQVSITTESTAETVQIRIADNGPGIPKPIREQVFEEEVMGQESGGSGLGLHLVRELVTRYNGDIEIRENLPRGTVVVVTLRRTDSSSDHDNFMHIPSNH